MYINMQELENTETMSMTMNQHGWQKLNNILIFNFKLLEKAVQSNIEVCI